MSDSTTAAPAAAPAADTAPPAAPRTDLSVSDAARLLSQQRRQATGEAPAEGRTTAPSPRPPAAAGRPTEAAAPPPAPEDGLTALERALGVSGEAPAPAEAATIELEGQRYSPAQLREYISKATDYTQKTQDLANRQRALAEQANALAQVLPYIQPELARLGEILQGARLPDPALAQTDPTRYVQERAAYDAAVAEQQRLGQLTALQADAHNRAMEQQVAQANEALAKEFPFWADEKDRLAAQQQIVAWATDKGGYQRDELRGLTDARHLKTMMKAMMFDRWVSGTKTAAPAPQIAAPVRGARPPPLPAARMQQAEQNFDTAPTIRNATALLGARRGNGLAR
ncbi:MAG TPA: hypothetical protein VGH84_02725 [Steroidobacteraceae bacterium]|jgi:hypothetical protein